MLGKKGFRISICLTLVLLFTLSFASTSAFATDSKVVTVTKPYSIVAPLEAVSSIRSSMMSSTYSYDDGIYKGTLPYAGMSTWSQTPYNAPSTTPLYTFTFSVTYSGTVTSIPDQKTMTVQRLYNIVAPLEAVNSIRNSMMNSTYSYDDGTYKGTLSYAGMSTWSQTPYNVPSTTPLYMFTFTVTYTGLVTRN